MKRADCRNRLTPSARRRETASLEIRTRLRNRLVMAILHSPASVCCPHACAPRTTIGARCHDQFHEPQPSQEPPMPSGPPGSTVFLRPNHSSRSMRKRREIDQDREPMTGPLTSPSPRRLFGEQSGRSPSSHGSTRKNFLSAERHLLPFFYA